MTILPIDEGTIRLNTEPQSFQRGQDYYAQEAVISLILRGQTLSVLVQGSEIRPYRVNIGFTEDSITSANCTCPYDYEGWCKHIVATLLTCTHGPDRIDERASLEELLDPLNQLQLQGLIQTLVAKHPEIIESIERAIHRIIPPSLKQSSPMNSPTVTINPTSYRGQVRRLIREAVRYIEEDYSEEDPVPEDLYALVEEARAYCERGESHNALAILEAITSTCSEEWDELDDYGANNDELSSELDKVWTEAILTSEFTPTEKANLAEKLSQWGREWGANFDMSLEALKQGWDYPPLVRVLQGEITPFSLWEQNPPDYADDLALIRLKILESQERDQEYLYLAQAEAQNLPYLNKLIALDRVEEAMKVIPSRLKSMEEALFVAKALRDDGWVTEALYIAQRGLTLSGNAAHELALWTSELAEFMGEEETALAARIKAFQAKPSFSHYQKLEALAGEDWSALQPDLLDYLRDYDSWYATRGKVDIFLHEGLVEEAIKTVPNADYTDLTVIYRVMDAAASVNPDWVIDNARRRAEAIIDAKKSEYYDEAIIWLKKARAAFYQSERKTDWQAYRERLMKDHARKHKFMGLFKHQELQ